MDSSNDDGAFRPTDKASVALLRHLRAGGDDVHFVHRVDVCDAPPEVLVTDLAPVPGTGLDDDGYSRIWYLYHAKKFTNTRGKLSGHRHRKVADGGGTYWHSEISRKDVQGSGGGTFCTFSYGIKTERSARSIDRLGWCMIEYDFIAADKKQDEAASNYVLCKVYRSPRAKGKTASASASASSSKNVSSKAAKKRKAGGGDHPEAPPAKLQDAYPTVPCYGYGPPENVDPMTMLGGEEEHGVQQARVELEAEHVDGGEFNVEELLNMEEFTNAYPTIPCYVHGGPQDVDQVTMFGGDQEHGVQQPRVEPEYCGEFNFDGQMQMQMLVQQDPASFTHAYPTMPCSSYGLPQGMDPVMMAGGEQEHGVLQPRVEPEYGGEFNFDELLNIDEQVQQDPAAAFTFTNAYPTMAACYGHDGTQGVDPAMFGDVEPKHGGDLGEFNFEELLKADSWKDDVVSGGLLYAC